MSSGLRQIVSEGTCILLRLFASGINILDIWFIGVLGNLPPGTAGTATNTSTWMRRVGAAIQNVLRPVLILNNISVAGLGLNIVVLWLV